MMSLLGVVVSAIVGATVAAGYLIVLLFSVLGIIGAAALTAASFLKTIFGDKKIHSEIPPQTSEMDYDKLKEKFVPRQRRHWDYRQIDAS